MISVVIPLGPNRESTAISSLEKQEEKVEIIPVVGINTSKNRNKGAEKARGEIVAFVNGHTSLPRDWSKKIIEFFNSHPEVDIVGGPQMTPPDDSRFGKISGCALSSIFGSAETSARYKSKKVKFANEKFLTSSNLACRFRVFEKVKFDESIYPGEDPKFISDAIAAGFRIEYSPSIVAFNKRREDIKGLAQQIFDYGKVRAQKESFIETLKKPSFLIPSLFLVYLILFPILSLVSYVILIPAGIYVLLNLFFSLYESPRNNRIAIFPSLFFIFFTIHISYGAGFIYGVVKNKMGILG